MCCIFACSLGGAKLQDGAPHFFTHWTSAHEKSPDVMCAQESETRFYFGRSEGGPGFLPWWQMTPNNLHTEGVAAQPVELNLKALSSIHQAE